MEFLSIVDILLIGGGKRMNRICLTGKILRNALMQGDQERILTFLLETETAIKNRFTERRRIALVPCLVYEANRDLVQFLTTKAMGKTVVCEGYVERSSHQNNGVRKFRTDVVIKPETMEFVR